MNRNNLIRETRNQVVFSFYTDFDNAITFNCIVLDGHLTIVWGDLVFRTRVVMYQNLWTHIAITWRPRDGRLFVFVQRPGLPDERDVVIGVLRTCYFGIDGGFRLGRALEPIPVLDQAVSRRRSTAQDVGFQGHMDEVRFWNQPLSEEYVSENFVYPQQGHADNLLVVFNFDDAQVTSGRTIEAQQYGLDSTRCRLRGQLTLPNPAPPLFPVSTAPLLFRSTTGCIFTSSQLETQANALCNEWFSEGVLFSECSALGALMQFYHRACVCDIARYRDLSLHKPSVCLFAHYCAASGVSSESKLLSDYCDGDVVLATTPLPPIVTEDDDDGPGRSVFTDENWPFYITVIVSVVCMLFVFAWCVIMTLYTRHKHQQEVLDKEALLDVELGDMDHGEEGDLSFVNPMFEVGHVVQDVTMMPNPLYVGPTSGTDGTAATAATSPDLVGDGAGVRDASAPFAPAGSARGMADDKPDDEDGSGSSDASDPGVNYQENELGLLDFDMFDADAHVETETSFSAFAGVVPTAISNRDSQSGKQGDAGDDDDDDAAAAAADTASTTPAAMPELVFPPKPENDTGSGASWFAVLAAVRDQPWMHIEIEVDHRDCIFYVDGKHMSTNRLAGRVQDGPGEIRIGQRAPGRFSFKGEMRNLFFYPGKDVVDDSTGEQREEVSSEYVDLLLCGDDANGAVKPGSEEGSVIFDGSKSCFLGVPGDVHPAPHHRFKISVEVRPTSDTKGYIVAKTDETGTTRRWAIGLTKSAAGTSIQFYYMPDYAEIGHCITSANVGRYTSSTMDSEYVITGDDPEAMKDIKAYRARLREEAGSDMMEVSRLSTRRKSSVSGASSASGSDAAATGRRGSGSGSSLRRAMDKVAGSMRSKGKVRPTAIPEEQELQEQQPAATQEGAGSTTAGDEDKPAAPRQAFVDSGDTTTTTTTTGVTEEEHSL